MWSWSECDAVVAVPLPANDTPPVEAIVSVLPAGVIVTFGAGGQRYVARDAAQRPYERQGA